MQPAFTLDVLNTTSRSEFAAALGDIFEHAPWVAESAYLKRPFATVTALHEAMLAALTAASPETTTAFLNNHPNLAGPAARPRNLTAASAQEQSIAGLDELTVEEAARLARWNAQYRERFGFPFIICARRHSHDSIFAEFQRRAVRDAEVERRAALSEIARISALRLYERVDGPGKPKVHGRLSTHLLDTARGVAAAGVAVQLFVLSKTGSARLVAEAMTDDDGRTPQPLIATRPIPIGTYELRFAIGDYLATWSGADIRSFLDIVPIRFGVAEPEAHYHIPLLFTPWSYSTYRGS
jgi:2-oxo-4-hydroxy-4-carboxy-5-ureidoimidazoline decarboxylase